MLADRFDVRQQPNRGARFGKVGCDDAGVAELGGQRLQPVLAPRRQHQPQPALRQLPGELCAQPGRCAGDQRDGRAHDARWMVALTILPGLAGGSPAGSESTCSMPLSTSPQTVYWLSRKVASSRQMKNWLLALSGSDVRAIEQTPRTCGSELNSAFKLGRSDPPMPMPLGSPPWAMKPGITRWKMTPS